LPRSSKFTKFLHFTDDLDQIRIATQNILNRFIFSDLDQLESILNNSADLQTLIDLTQGLFHLEVISKIFSGILEAFCITYGFGHYPPGCTPGKFLMGLRIVSCLDVQPVNGGAPNQVMVTRHAYVNLKR
jgi:hypothetical protein